MKSKLFLLTVILFFFSCATVRTVNENATQIFQQIDNADFKMSFNFAYPFRMQAVPLTSDYSLRISGDSAYAYLPYFGVAHTAPFNPSKGGIQFEAPMQDYIVKPNRKKDGKIITFRVRKGVNDYRLTLQVFDNAKVSLNVSDTQRDPITFVGEVKL